MDSQKKKIFSTSRNCGNLKKYLIQNRIFFWCIAAIPILVLIFNQVFINFNSVLLAFRTYRGGTTYLFAGFENFTQVLIDFTTKSEMLVIFKNSLFVYLLSVVVTAVIPIVFSYYMFKKMPGHAFFKVVLFLPNIISSLITVLIFRYVADRVFPLIFGLEFGLLSNPDGSVVFTTILCYTLWLSFGAGLLTQIGAMNSTDKQTIEAGMIDGVGFFGELWHIVLPKSYGIISIAFYTGFISLFTNQFGLYAFYGDGAPSNLQTFGYMFIVKTTNAKVAEYPYWAAWGLIASAIAIPVTFLLRRLVYCFGPSED